MIVVTGASGGVGVALVQLAVARGADVIAVCSASKADGVREAGAPHVVDPAGDVLSDVRRIAPDGVTAVLDVVAGPHVRAGIPLLRPGGRWVVVHRRRSRRGDTSESSCCSPLPPRRASLSA